jgi:hypothetical protein
MYPEIYKAQDTICVVFFSGGTAIRSSQTRLYFLGRNMHSLKVSELQPPADVNDDRATPSAPVSSRRVAGSSPYIIFRASPAASHPCAPPLLCCYLVLAC